MITRNRFLGAFALFALFGAVLVALVFGGSAGVASAASPKATEVVASGLNNQRELTFRLTGLAI
ncbi:MAG TPA: hypothetical protein VNI02_01695 [Blastocatellia bacterium]|jgi:hypothetical protein|nr:hypothetical protein [Blastocatellia bacterium]